MRSVRTIRTLLVSFFILIYSGCSSSDESNREGEINPETATFYHGMDLSFQPELREYNIAYKDENGVAIDLLPFVKSKGTNLIRLKLWHTPLDGQNSLEDVIAYAKEVKELGLDFLLDIHFSDYWADPGKQTPPRAWQSLTFSQLESEVFSYSKDVFEILKDNNVVPQIVQIGNETDSGFLWDYGRVWDAFDDNWENYASLVKKAIEGIRSIADENETKIALHHSSVENAIYFFEKIQPFSIDYQIIALSYYPQFQIKNLDLVQAKLNQLATLFEKNILIAEVAYPFSLEYNEDLTNYIGSIDQTISGYPPTPEGQLKFFQKFKTMLKTIPNKRGIGFCYWAPDWVAFEGNQDTSTTGSAWENQCIWNFEHQALPVIRAFEHQ